MEPVPHAVNDKFSVFEVLATQADAGKPDWGYVEEQHVRLVQRNHRSPACDDELQPDIARCLLEAGNVVSTRACVHAVLEPVRAVGHQMIWPLAPWND